MTDKADLLIRAATVVDGSGLPAYTADVEVRDGRIARVGHLPGAEAEREIDADGLYVTPGFVDVHTHYEPQLHFEPTASPSSWHGVTTVLTGNCGFSIAPSKAEDLDWLTLMLAKVEGMSVDALRAGVNFPGGTVADFLANLEGRIGVNMAYYVADSAVRRWVMGDDASERTATDTEVEAMKALVDRGMKDGAIGFSTSQLDVHADHNGRPIPSNLASSEELVALTSVLANYPEGVVEHLCRSFATGYDESDRKLLRDIAIAVGREDCSRQHVAALHDRPGHLEDLPGCARGLCAGGSARLSDGIGQSEGTPRRFDRYRHARRDADLSRRVVGHRFRAQREVTQLQRSRGPGEGVQ